MSGPTFVIPFLPQGEEKNPWVPEQITGAQATH